MVMKILFSPHSQMIPFVIVFLAGSHSDMKYTHPIQRYSWGGGSMACSHWFLLILNRTELILKTAKHLQHRADPQTHHATS